jgi:hypothetical protein
MGAQPSPMQFSVCACACACSPACCRVEAPACGLPPTACVHADECTLQLSANGTSAVLSFTKEGPYKDCSNALGGGVRGVFRVERLQQQAGAAPLGWKVLSAASSAPGSSRSAAAAAGKPGARAAAGASAASDGAGAGTAPGSAGAAQPPQRSKMARLALDSAWDSDEERRHYRERAAAASAAGQSSAVGGAPPMPHLGPAPAMADRIVWDALDDGEEAP